MSTNVNYSQYFRKDLMNELQFLIYTAENDSETASVIIKGETIWASQKEMARLFDVGVPAISKHLKNIFEEGELEEKATISKMETVQIEGSREVVRQVDFYNLDAIISVGYRVKSATATQFRIWATKRLREYLVQGYSINEQRLEQLGQIAQVLSRSENPAVAGTGEVLASYLPSLHVLRDYDDGVIVQQSDGRSPVWELGYEDAQAIIARLREEFPDDVLLGVENGDGLQSVVATIYQSFAG